MDSKILKSIEYLKHTKPQDLSSFLQSTFKDKNIAIYGAGAFGKEIASVFLRHNIKPKFFLDIKQEGSLFDIPIIHPKKLEDHESIVVLAIVLHKTKRMQIMSYMHSLGLHNIVDAQTIRALYVNLNGDFSYEYFMSKISEILKPLTYLADKESKETYAKNLIAHITRSYIDTKETDEETQYFVKNVPFKRGCKFLIDCGAYIGDTFLECLKQNAELEEYIGFEPILESYEQLVNNIEHTTVKAMAMPVAVSNQTKVVEFTNMLGSSTINNNAYHCSKITTMCFRLDDLVHNYSSPTMIKMDIEGEEINALNGAKNLIKYAQPELAISVYHIINHFWEIPNMLYGWNLDYEFYLRTHSSACMETVLYAVKKD